MKKVQLLLSILLLVLPAIMMQATENNQPDCPMYQTIEMIPQKFRQFFEVQENKIRHKFLKLIQMTIFYCFVQILDEEIDSLNYVKVIKYSDFEKRPDFFYQNHLGFYHVYELDQGKVCFRTSDEVFIFKQVYFWEKFCPNLNTFQPNVKLENPIKMEETEIEEIDQGENQQNILFQFDIDGFDYVFQNDFDESEIEEIKNIEANTNDIQVQKSVKIKWAESKSKRKFVVKYGPREDIFIHEILYFNVFSNKKDHGSFLGCFVDDKRVYIVQKYYPYNIFQTAFQKFILKTNRLQRIAIYLSIAQELDKLHQLELIHYDVKPDNLVIDENLNFHLIDFGFTKKVGAYQIASGTILYNSPLMKKCTKAEPIHDSYGLAMTFAAIESLKVLPKEDLIQKIYDLRGTYFQNKSKKPKLSFMKENTDLVKAIQNVFQKDTWTESEEVFKIKDTQTVLDLELKVLAGLNENLTPDRIYLILFNNLMAYECTYYQSVFEDLLKNNGLILEEENSIEEIVKDTESCLSYVQKVNKKMFEEEIFLDNKIKQEKLSEKEQSMTENNERLEV